MSEGKPAVAARDTWASLVSTLLMMLAMIGAVAFSAFPLALPLGWLSQPQSRLAVFLGGSVCGELAALGVLAWRLRRRGTSLRDLGLGKPTTLPAVALGLVVAVVYAGVTALNPSVGANLLLFSPLKVLALVAALVAGLVEETIFRGYVMTAMRRLGRGWVLQVLASGALFALAHVYGFASLQAWLISGAFTFALGVALAGVYLAGRRSLTRVILSHALIDAVIEPWLLLSFFVGR